MVEEKRPSNLSAAAHKSVNVSSWLPRKASFLITVRRPLFVGVLLLEVFGLAVFVVEPLALERAGAAVADEGLRFVAAEKRVGRVVFFVDRDVRAVGGFSASSSGVEGSVILFEGSWAKERFSFPFLFSPFSLPFVGFLFFVDVVVTFSLFAIVF